MLYSKRLVADAIQLMTLRSRVIVGYLSGPDVISGSFLKEGGWRVRVWEGDVMTEQRSEGWNQGLWGRRGSMSQWMLVPPAAGKGKETDSPQSPDDNLILAQWGPFWMSELQSYKMRNLCCLKPLKFVVIYLAATANEYTLLTNLDKS